MMFHVTYRDRYSNSIEVVRIGVQNNPRKTAAQQRAAAIQTTACRYPGADRRSISAVHVRPPALTADA